MNISSDIIISKATMLSKKHMTGKVNSRTKEQHPDSLANEVKNMDYSQLINQIAAKASTICGDKYTVANLCDFTAARG